MEYIKNTIIILIILAIFANCSLFADVEPSPRRMATGDISDDVYDTYDYITGRPEKLSSIKGFQIILFPDELVDDTFSLINIINGIPERSFHNRIAIGFGTSQFGIGAHFNNYYIKGFSATNNTDVTLSDYDNDGISLETNEIKNTYLEIATNYDGNENIDFGAGIGFAAGSVSFGISYQGFMDDEINENNVTNSESYENNYGTDKKNDHTYSFNRLQNIEKDHQHHIILNFGVERLTIYFDKNKDKIEVKDPVFLLETRFIMFKEHEITRSKYTRTVYDDPEGNISSTLYNKTVYNGLSAFVPTTEEDIIREGYKLQFKPKLSTRPTTKLQYNFQGKFGIGIGIIDDKDRKDINSYTEYETDIPASHQDTYSYYNEIVEDYEGKGKYLMYGLRIEQVFRPKYFIIGMALNATVEHNTKIYSGTTTRTIKEQYDSTTTNYSLAASFGSKRYILTEYPEYVKGTTEEKEIYSTVSIPVGFEFELAKYIKLRAGYTYRIDNYTTITKKAMTNNYKRKKTTDYEDPTTADTVEYDSINTYLENNVETVTSVKLTYNILTAGVEVIISENVSLNVAGYYAPMLINNNIWVLNASQGKVIVDTKFKF